jgi:hypothetical protein
LNTLLSSISEEANGNSKKELAEKFRTEKSMFSPVPYIIPVAFCSMVKTEILQTLHDELKNIAANLNRFQIEMGFKTVDENLLPGSETVSGRKVLILFSENIPQSFLQLKVNLSSMFDNIGIQYVETGKNIEIPVTLFHSEYNDPVNQCLINSVPPRQIKGEPEGLALFSVEDEFFKPGQYLSQDAFSLIDRVSFNFRSD